MSMQPKISNEALEAYCNCTLKFYFKLRGKHGVKTDYEIMRADMRADTQAKAITNLDVKQRSRQRGVRLSWSRLNKETAYIFRGLYEDDDLKLTIDAIHKVVSHLDPSIHSFRPILFTGSTRIEKHHRLMLQMYGYVISRIAERQIPVGLIWDARDTTSNVRLKLDSPDFTNWLQELLSRIYA